jgi:hypothetical protein
MKDVCLDKGALSYIYTLYSKGPHRTSPEALIRETIELHRNYSQHKHERDAVIRNGAPLLNLPRTTIFKSTFSLREGMLIIVWSCLLPRAADKRRLAEVDHAILSDKENT